ncbi:histidine kinase-like ATPase [Ochromonadaceae sp. CCMP2298]|nr:histidine kinase-like ATPase [Ochromonadaceae sp. CCMP2298]
MTFYPTEDFIGNYRTHLPIIIACSSVMLILLVLLVFVGYDVAVRGEAARKEIVMDTKRRFVRFVSHEIRTPMNAVRLGMTLFSTEIDGLVAKLAGKSLEEVMGVLHTTLTDWRQIAVDVLDNTVAAVDVLNDLLNYDKIESGTLRLEFSSLPIWQVIKMATRSFALQAKEKNICLSLSGAPWDAAAQELQYQALQVVGDSMRISQLLRNLMSNAIKFTPASGSISFHAEWLPEALADAQIDMTPQESQQWLSYARAGAVRVSVTDTGAGLSPEQLSEIGAEGVQFNANQLQAGQGSGLGLFISKGITQQHGGTFNVTSLGLNCGATFSILLPLFNIPPPEELSSAHLSRSSAAESSGRALGSSGTPRILVVDDANSNRKMLLRILRAKNYVCEEAENGRVAVEKYAAAAERGEPFDVILSDYEMPVMNGPDSVWEMRRMGCKCFIAGITGNVLQVDIDHFKERGADNVLAKPLDIGVFESLFRNFKPRETPYSRETSSQRVSYARETSSLRLGGGASVRFGAESARVRPALPTSPTSPTPPSAPMPPCSAPSEKVIGGSIITVSEGAGSGAGSMWAGTRTQKLTGITASEREEHPYSCLGSPLEEV